MEASLNILGSPAERDAMIKKVLDQNNKAIDDIDGLLATINNTYCSWFNHYFSDKLYNDYFFNKAGYVLEV